MYYSNEDLVTREAEGEISLVYSTTVHKTAGKREEELLLLWIRRDGERLGGLPYAYLHLQTDEGLRVRILQQGVRQDRARMYRLQQHALHEYRFKS